MILSLPLNGDHFDHKKNADNDDNDEQMMIMTMTCTARGRQLACVPPALTLPSPGKTSP